MNGAAMYSATQIASQDDLLDKHAVLVKRIAHHLMSRLPPSVQIEDLIQAGMIGLTGTKAEIDKVVKAYHAHYMVIPGQTSNWYSINHTTTVYLHDKEGKVRYLVRGAIEWDDAETIGIIESLLYLSRFDQGRIGWDPRPVNLNALVEQYAADRLSLAEARDLRLTQDRLPA